MKIRVLYNTVGFHVVTWCFRLNVSFELGILICSHDREFDYLTYIEFVLAFKTPSYSLQSDPHCATANAVMVCRSAMFGGTSMVCI